MRTPLPLSAVLPASDTLPLPMRAAPSPITTPVELVNPLPLASSTPPRTSIGPVALCRVLSTMKTPVAESPLAVCVSTKDCPRPVTEIAPLVEFNVAPDRRTPLP